MAPSSVIFLNIFPLLILLLSSIIMVDARANKTEMINQFLDAHNSARKAVGVPALKWEPLLANFAHAYSNQRRHDCALAHSTAMAYGENIFIGQGRRWSANDAVAAWVAEKQFYDYARNGCSRPNCTHYTQIVWRTTEQVGCAKIICDKSMGAATSVVSIIPQATMLGPGRTDLVWPLGPVCCLVESNMCWCGVERVLRSRQLGQPHRFNFQE